jgi:hypothetical protein
MFPPMYSLDGQILPFTRRLLLSRRMSGGYGSGLLEIMVVLLRLIAPFFPVLHVRCSVRVYES